MRPELATLASLLAQMDRFRNMGGNFRGEGAAVSPSELLALVAIVLLIVAGVVALYLSLDGRDRPRKWNSPAGLLRELCRVHDLHRSERRLLERAAARQAPADPGRLFVCPDLLDAALAEAPAPQAAALRAKLFGDLPDVPPRTKLDEAVPAS